MSGTGTYPTTSVDSIKPMLPNCYRLILFLSFLNGDQVGGLARHPKPTSDRVFGTAAERKQAGLSTNGGFDLGFFSWDVTPKPNLSDSDDEEALPQSWMTRLRCQIRDLTSSLGSPA